MTQPFYELGPLPSVDPDLGAARGGAACRVAVSRLNEKKQFRRNCLFWQVAAAHHDAFGLHSFWPQGLAWQKSKEKKEKEM